MKTLDEHTISSAVHGGDAAIRHHRSLSFDSYARNEADEESDVDICIECGDSITLFSLGGPGVALEAALGRSVDVVCGSNSFHPRAQQRYLKDRNLLYAKS